MLRWVAGLIVICGAIVCVCMYMPRVLLVELPSISWPSFFAGVLGAQALGAIGLLLLARFASGLGTLETPRHNEPDNNLLTQHAPVDADPLERDASKK